jgi:hypothetical protein
MSARGPVAAGAVTDGVATGDGDGVGKKEVVGVVAGSSTADPLEIGGTGAVNGLESDNADGADRGLTGAVGTVSSNESPPLAFAAEALKSAAAPATLSSAFAKS